LVVFLFAQKRHGQDLAEGIRRSADDLPLAMRDSRGFKIRTGLHLGHVYVAAGDKMIDEDFVGEDGFEYAVFRRDNEGIRALLIDQRDSLRRVAGNVVMSSHRTSVLLYFDFGPVRSPCRVCGACCSVSAHVFL